MTTLHLNLKGEYFDQIKSGEKLFEYRLYSKWYKRLVNKPFDTILVKRGYPKANDTSRIVVRPWQGFVVQELLHPLFGDTPVQVCAIKVN